MGRQILDGKHRAVRIHGRRHPVRAKASVIHGLSAHADRQDLLRWLEHFKREPKRVYLTHGDKDAAASLASAVKCDLGWPVEVPSYRQIAMLK